MEQGVPKDAALQAMTPDSGGGKEQVLLKQLSEVNSGGSPIGQLFDNPFFTAGFGLAALGAAARYGTLGLRRGGELLRRRMLVDLEITRHDESYPWILNWMTAHYQQQLAPAKAGGTERLVSSFSAV
jgi:chaperone BCS1